MKTYACSECYFRVPADAPPPSCPRCRSVRCFSEAMREGKSDMKTYACSRCGNRTEWGWNNESLECGECGGEMHALDGIVSGGGVKAIWRDGREVWSGTAMEAVELLEKYWASIEFAREVESDIRAERTISSREYLAQLQLEKDRCVEADWIVRKASDTYDTMTQTLEAMIRVRSAACDYVAKYPKT